MPTPLLDRIAFPRSPFARMAVLGLGFTAILSGCPAPGGNSDAPRIDAGTAASNPEDGKSKSKSDSPSDAKGEPDGKAAPAPNGKASGEDADADSSASAPAPELDFAVDPETPPRDGGALYTITGIVREVNADRKRVVVRHEEIPGFMPLMTMPLPVDSAEMLRDVYPEDEIEAKLMVEFRGGEVVDYRLIDLFVTQEAPSGKVLDPLTGELKSVEEKPKRLVPGDPFPDLTLRTQEGKTIKISDLRGKWVVLTFIYTRCPLPNYCPRMDNRFRELAGLLRAAPARAEGTRLLSISFDPEHDTPEVLARHAAALGAVPPLWTFAAANHDELAREGPKLGLVYGPREGEIVHNLCTAIIDPEGRLARLDADEKSNEATAAELLRGIGRAARDEPAARP